jgi:hypothetical protein
MSAKPSAVYRNRMQRYQDSVWLIWSNKWGCWYGPNCQGYTSDIAQAGIYGRDVAAKHYLPDAPRKHRDVEPFPLSSVQALVRRRIDQLLGEITAQQALIVRLSTLKDMRP